MPRTGITPHLIQVSASPTASPLTPSKQQRRQEGGQRWHNLQGTVLTVAFRNDGSWSCGARSMGQGWSHVPILQRGKPRPGLGLE